MAEFNILRNVNVVFGEIFGSDRILLNESSANIFQGVDENYTLHKNAIKLDT